MEKNNQKIDTKKSLLNRIEKMEAQGKINLGSEEPGKSKKKKRNRQPRERRERRKRGPGFFTRLLLKIAIFLIIVLIVLLVLRGFTKQTIEKRSMVVEQQLIYSQELVSLKYRYSDIISIKKSVPLAKSYSIVKYTGTIRAGIKDMTLCDFEVSETGRAVKVILPEAEVLGNDITTQEVFDESHSMFVPITIEEVFTEIDAARQDVLEEFLNQGILEEARKNAILVIKQLLVAAGFDSVEVF